MSLKVSVTNVILFRQLTVIVAVESLSFHFHFQPHYKHVHSFIKIVSKRFYRI